MKSTKRIFREEFFARIVDFFPYHKRIIARSKKKVNEKIWL